MNKIPILVWQTSGFLILSSLIVFFAIELAFRYFGYFQSIPFSYYKSTLISVTFVYPLIYSLSVFRMLYLYNKTESHNFLFNFRFSFMTMFMAGFVSLLVIYFYFNFLQPASIEILVNQQLDLMLNFGNDSEQVNAMRDNIDQSGAREQNLFSFDRVFGKYLPAIILFYLFISFIIGSFFKK